MRIFFISLLLGAAGALSAQQVILTGLMDGTINFSPRAVEIYVDGTVNLSGYELARYANGQSTPTDVTALSGTYTDEFVYIIKDDNDADFTATFGTSGDFSNRILGANLLGNGDDAFAILQGGTVIDVVGVTIGTDPDNYRDSWLYRNDNTGPDGAWVAANWMNVGNNDALDGFSFAQMGAAVPFGTYSRMPAGPTVSVAADGDLAEPSQNGGFVITLNQAAAAPLTVTYTLSGTADLNDYADPQNGSVTFPAGVTSVDVIINVVDDADSEPLETLTLDLASVSDASYALGGGATINVIDDEPIGSTPIHAVQGNGNASTLVGQTVQIDGVVVGDFQGGSGVGLNGFFVQEPDADQDNDPLTSEGIWVFDENSTLDVAVGDFVNVTGVVSEFGNLTQIDVTDPGASVSIVPGNNAPLPTAVVVDFPLAVTDELERYEGMRFTFNDPMVVTSNFGLGRFGEIEVSEGERLVQFTECNSPDPTGLATYNAQQSLRRLIIDDGRSGDNNFPIVLPDGDNLTPSNTLRAGAVLTGFTGVMDERFTGYRAQPVDRAGLSLVDNPRPATPPSVGGNLKIVGVNVLNYFTTLGSRGADNQAEFDRQEAKIVAALCALDADIIGLVEIEDNGFGPNGALQTLIDAIAAECGIAYEAVVHNVNESDDIQVALIYKTATVEESGTVAVVDDAANGFDRNRNPVAQTFRVIEAGNPDFGEEITVCVNHWKSKGSSCGSPSDDVGGAGNCNGNRLAAAQFIRAWLAGDPTMSDSDGAGPDEEVTAQLVIGDLNAYSQEDPILEFTDNGWVNAVRAQAPAGSFPCGGVASYIFRGEWGSLDHALASPSLATMVTGATPWNVNAAEPTALDYDTQFNDPALYAPDVFRFSDHDPIVVGVALGASLPVTLVEISGEEVDGTVVLNWATSREINSDRFGVERRDANGNFQEIGSVLAAGNSEERREYSFTDSTPELGRNAYRLRMIDRDGSEEFSPVIIVEVDQTNSISVVGVGNNAFRFQNVPLGTTYRLVGGGGAQVRSGVTRAMGEEMDAAGLPAGMYFLLLELPGGKREVVKVVVR